MPYWYTGHELEWLLPEDFVEAGYNNIDIDYQPIFSAKDVTQGFEENYEEYYKRGATVTKSKCKQ